jgi:hypothetical protein
VPEGDRVTQTRAWRNFKRMQDVAVTAGSLVYAAAVVHAWRVLPGPAMLKSELTLLFPAGFLLLFWVGPLIVPPVRRLVERYVWMSFAAGFGQSVGSVIVGLGVLLTAAAFIYLQVGGVARGGRYPAGVFSGYGAGIGILLAQAIVVRLLERRPDLKGRIEEG